MKVVEAKKEERLPWVEEAAHAYIFCEDYKAKVGDMDRQKIAPKQFCWTVWTGPSGGM